jgi:hypothetical protein
MTTYPYISNNAVDRLYKDNMSCYVETFLNNASYLNKIMLLNFNSSFRFYIDFDSERELYVMHHINHLKNRETRNDFYYAWDLRIFVDKMMRAFCIL